MKEEIGVKLFESNFFGYYPGTSFYHPERVYNEQVYLAKIEGEIIPDAEIESYVWFSREDFLTKKYPMIPNTEEKIIPDLIEKGLL